jgi:hypothetical protein
MAVSGLIGLIALFVAGIVLTIGAILWLMPLEAETRIWTALIVGLILMIIGAVVLAMLFSQRRWLELSRSYDLMDAVIEPVPTAASVPKNFIRAFKGQPTAHAPRESIQPHPPRMERRPVERPISLRPQEV